MEKIKINTQIVRMRNHVKQAKVHCINKLAKEAVKLQNRKGNEKEVEKCKRKAKRYLEEISIIQKIKPDILSKKALCKIKDWKAVLQKKDSSLEDRCLAMLVTFKGVQETIDKFFNANFRLVPKIPSLIEDMERSAAQKKLEKEQRKMDRKLKKLEKLKKVTNSSDSNKKAKELEQSEENKSNEFFDTQSGSVQTESQSESIYCAEDMKDKLPDDDYLRIKMETDVNSGALKDVPLFDNNEALSEDDINEKLSEYHILSEIRKIKKETDVNSDLKDVPLFDDNKKKALSEDEVDKNTSSEDEFDELSVNDNDNESRKTPSVQSNKKKMKKKQYTRKKSKLTSTVTSSENNKQEDVSRSKKSLKAVALLNLEELKDCDEIPIGHSEDISEDQSNDSVKRKRDGFFLNDGSASDSEDSTHSDQEENKFFNGKRKRFEDHNHSLNKFQFSSEKFQTNYSGNKFQKRNSNEKFPFSKKFPARESFKKDRFGPRKDFRGDGKNNNIRNKDTGFKQQEKLNPFSDSSRDQRSNFKDKKFSPKFKSNDTFNQEKPYQKKSMPSIHKNVPAEPKKFHKEKSANSTNTDKPLHPSWEAKRKLKNTAPVQFQGKRMVFDD